MDDKAFRDFMRAWEWATNNRPRHLSAVVADWMIKRLIDFEARRA